MKWCPDCRTCAICAEDQRCPDCQRRQAWGKILAVLHWVERAGPGLPCDLALDDALAGVAFLMRERVALVRKHNADMGAEQRYASRSAGEAFDEGRLTGRREGNDGW